MVMTAKLFYPQATKTNQKRMGLEQDQRVRDWHQMMRRLKNQLMWELKDLTRIINLLNLLIGKSSTPRTKMEESSRKFIGTK